MKIIEETKKYMKRNFDVSSAEYHNKKLEDFIKKIEYYKNKSVNENKLNVILSQFAKLENSIWYLNKNKIIHDVNKKWDKIIDIIAENNLQYIIKNTNLYKITSSKNKLHANFYNLYCLFIKDIKKENISKLVFEKFINLIDFEYMTSKMPYKENYISLLSLLIESGKTEFVEILIKKHGKDKIFNWNLEIYKHNNSSMANSQKQNFIGFIMDSFIYLPFILEKEKDILKKKHLENMKNYFIKNIDDELKTNNEQENIKNQQINNIIRIRDFLNTEELEILIDKNLLKKQHVFAGVQFIIDKMKELTTEKQENIIKKLLDIEKIKIFDLYKLILISPSINQIEFITTKNIFSDDDYANKIMSLYFSYHNPDENIYNYFLNSIDKELLSESDKDNILLLSLDVISLKRNTNLFATILENGILKNIYERVNKKEDFQERLTKIAMNNAKSLAYHDKFLRIMNNMNFNPYKKISWNKGEYSFKDVVTEPYLSSVDKIFINERIDAEKNKLISIVNDNSENDFTNKKRRL